MREKTNRGNAILITIILVVIAVGAVWYFLARGAKPSASQSAQGNQVTPPAQVTQNKPIDTSDASIEGDLTSVDSNISALSADDAAIDKGLNDKPITQDY